MSAKGKKDKDKDKDKDATEEETITTTPSTSVIEKLQLQRDMEEQRKLVRDMTAHHDAALARIAALEAQLAAVKVEQKHEVDGGSVGGSHAHGGNDGQDYVRYVTCGS